MSENPTPTDASSLTKTQLLQKQKEGTLTKEEKVQFLIKVRGMRPKDAENMIYHPPRFIRTEDIIHIED